MSRECLRGVRVRMNEKLTTWSITTQLRVIGESRSRIENRESRIENFRCEKRGYGVASL